MAKAATVQQALSVLFSAVTGNSQIRNLIDAAETTAELHIPLQFHGHILYGRQNGRHGGKKKKGFKTAPLNNNME